MTGVSNPAESSIVQGVVNVTWTKVPDSDEHSIMVLPTVYHVYVMYQADWLPQSSGPTYDPGFTSTYNTISYKATGTSMLYTFLNPTTTARVFVQAYAVDRYGYTYRRGTDVQTSGLFTILVRPPYAPSLLPASNFDKKSPKTFYWTYHDGGMLTYGLAYRLEIINAVTGATVVDTGKVPSGTPEHLLPANTLVNDVRYQWRVRTWDRSDTVGDASAWQTFYTSTTPVVTITAPGAPFTGTSYDYYDVVWTYTQAGGSPQATYQVVVVNTSSGATLFDSGVLGDASIRTVHATDLANLVTNTVIVTVTSEMGISSVPATQTLLPNFFPPDTPTVVVTQVLGGTRFDITNPTTTVGHHTPDYNQLWSTNKGNGHDGKPDGSFYGSANGYYLLMDNIPLNTTVYDYNIVGSAAAGGPGKTDTYFVRAVVA